MRHRVCRQYRYAGLRLRLRANAGRPLEGDALTEAVRRAVAEGPQ